MRLERIALAILLLGGVAIAATITSIGQGTTGAAGGNNTDVQFNAAGVISGNDRLTFAETATSNFLTVTDPNSLASVVLGNDAIPAAPFISGIDVNGDPTFQLSDNNLSLGDGLGGIAIACSGSDGICQLKSFSITPIASPPSNCDAAGEGKFYSDTSHALCWCDGTTWQKISGAGTCS